MYHRKRTLWLPSLARAHLSILFSFIFPSPSLPLVFSMYCLQPFKYVILFFYKPPWWRTSILLENPDLKINNLSCHLWSIFNLISEVYLYLSFKRLKNSMRCNDMVATITSHEKMGKWGVLMFETSVFEIAQLANECRGQTVHCPGRI